MFTNDPTQNKRAYEQLLNRVEELENQLAQRPTKDEAYKDLKKDLATYDEEIKTQGGITLKDNFVIKNRKAKEVEDNQGRIIPNLDNSAVLYFNKSVPNRLNHLFLGYNSAKGNYNSSVVSSAVTKKEGVAKITHQGEERENPNNGLFQVKLWREKYMRDGRPQISSPDGNQPNIIVSPREHFVGQAGIEGTVTQVQGTGKNPYASLGVFVEDNQNASTFVACDKDNVYIAGIPNSDPNVPGALWRDGTTLKISLG